MFYTNVCSPVKARISKKVTCRCLRSMSTPPRPNAGTMSLTSSSERGRMAASRRLTAAGASFGTFAEMRIGTVTAWATAGGWKPRSAAAPSLAYSPTSTTSWSAGAGSVYARALTASSIRPSSCASTTRTSGRSSASTSIHPRSGGGVAATLLEAAIERAAAHGAPILEGYAVRDGHMNIDAYTGYLSMFLEAGFEVIRDAGRRTIVRRGL